MRIAIYKDTLANRRGADVAVVGLAEGLRERGHDAVLFEKDELAARLAERWDVFVSTGTNELLDISRAGYRGAPVVQQFHTNPSGQFKRKRIFRNWKIRRALRGVAAIQVLREDFVPQVARYCPRVEVIGNWSIYDGRRRETDTGTSSGNVIVYPAALGKGKNQRLLVDAFSLLERDFPDWTVELYGKGTLPFRLPESVRLMGYRDLEEVYPRCAFLAFPSIDEGFGLAISDAAAFGLPAVLVNDWIGTASAGGALVVAPDARSYAEGLRRLMEDGTLRRSMGAKARLFCSQRYSRSAILDRWERLFGDITAA
jgi:glycosyltransferase involved in cell wall biosynthesis